MCYKTVKTCDSLSVMILDIPIVFKSWLENLIFHWFTFRILRLEEPKIASWSMARLLHCVAALFLCVDAFLADKFDEDKYGVKYADNCEICKIVTNEITLLLSESEGKHEVLETGYSVQKEKKKTKVIKPIFCPMRYYPQFRHQPTLFGGLKLTCWN